MLEKATEMYGEDHVALLDQGALYRMSVLMAHNNGDTTPDEVVSYALNIIQKNEPDAFLDEFMEIWNDPEKHHLLRSPEVSKVVAHVGKRDEAQEFFKDLFNLRIGRVCSQGAEVIIADSRTPRVLLDPSYRQGLIEWAMQVYMYTLAQYAANWAATKSGRPYSEHLDALDARNKFDENRQSYPNFSPKITGEHVTDITSVNHFAMEGRALEGSLWLPDTHLFVDNNGTFPPRELCQSIGSFARIALEQCEGNIARIY
jgi:hypothetical protein